MKSINKHLFILISIFFIFITIFNIYYSYKEMQKEANEFALSQSEILNNFMLIHKNYYQKLFANNTIPLNKNTLKALPDYTSFYISKKFSETNQNNIKVQTVSARPRNPKNQADEEELKAIKFFGKNKNKKEYFKFIDNDNNPYYQYGYALRINHLCLKCHGKKEDAPSFIVKRYNNAYNYKLGELRGIVSIKLPKKYTDKFVYKRFRNDVIFDLFLLLVAELVTFFLIIYLSKNKELLNKKTQRAEKLEKLEKAKSEFLANMSHEIRTPLNAITGFIDLLKEDIKEEKDKKYLEVIESSSESLLQIINDILDFSKIESGKLEIDKHPFESKKEFQIITALFDAKASEKNITLVLNIDKSLPEVLISDPLRIKQVIANLISNAIKFTPKGKKIYIKIYYKKRHLFVSVKDEGIGIPKDKQKYIFEAFSQADSSTTRKYGGSGLGLAISSKLIEMLGGELKLKSEEGKGSEFYFSIPVEIAKLEKKEKNITDNIDNFKAKRILVAEDNKANQLFIKILLKKLGFIVDIANDGIEAIEKFKNNRYDFVLMDENMPNMNGIEATKKILKYEKENNLSHTPIIALTANAIKGDRERFLDAGMDEYLTKPIDKQKLIKVLNLVYKKGGN